LHSANFRRSSFITKSVYPFISKNNNKNKQQIIEPRSSTIRQQGVSVLDLELLTDRLRFSRKKHSENIFETNIWSVLL